MTKPLAVCFVLYIYGRVWGEESRNGGTERKIKKKKEVMDF
jgi:hypothetical protein